jgi:hypothetical protein
VETHPVPIGPNRVLAALVGAVVLVAVVAGVVVANRTPPQFDPHTPQGVVQAYLKAVLDGDHSRAADLLSPSSGCGESDLALAAVPESARIVLDDAVVDGDRAVVTVKVTEGSGDELFGSSAYTHSERITLQRDAGVWQIAESPWLLSGCTAGKG